MKQIQRLVFSKRPAKQSRCSSLVGRPRPKLCTSMYQYQSLCILSISSFIVTTSTVCRVHVQWDHKLREWAQSGGPILQSSCTSARITELMIPYHVHRPDQYYIVWLQVDYIILPIWQGYDIKTMLINQFIYVLHVQITGYKLFIPSHIHLISSHPIPYPPYLHIARHPRRTVLFLKYCCIYPWKIFIYDSLENTNNLSSNLHPPLSQPPL